MYWHYKSRIDTLLPHVTEHNIPIAYLFNVLTAGVQPSVKSSGVGQHWRFTASLERRDRRPPSDGGWSRRGRVTGPADRGRGWPDRLPSCDGQRGRVGHGVGRGVWSVAEGTQVSRGTRRRWKVWSDRSELLRRRQQTMYHCRQTVKQHRSTGGQCSTIISYVFYGFFLRIKKRVLTVFIEWYITILSRQVVRPPVCLSVRLSGALLVSWDSAYSQRPTVLK